MCLRNPKALFPSLCLHILNSLEKTVSVSISQYNNGSLKKLRRKIKDIFIYGSISTGRALGPDCVHILSLKTLPLFPYFGSKCNLKKLDLNRLASWNLENVFWKEFAFWISHKIHEFRQQLFLINDLYGKICVGICYFRDS